MSGQYQDVGKGGLNPVEEKRSEKSPDFKGSVTIEGKEYWVSGWNRSGRNGEFISLAFQTKLAKDWKGGSANPPAQHATQGQTTTGNGFKKDDPAEGDFDDQIPF